MIIKGNFNVQPDWQADCCFQPEDYVTMKRMMLTGAILGFASGIGLAWHNGLPMQEAFWHACIGAYLGGMLLRWWGSIWFRGLRQSYQEPLRQLKIQLINHSQVGDHDHYA